MLKKILIAGLIALGSISCAAAPARAGDVEVTVAPIALVAPPPPRVETVVVRPGYVWSHGHYYWNSTRYVWIPGRYVTYRHGYVWNHPRYVYRANRYYYVRGHYVVRR